MSRSRSRFWNVAQLSEKNRLRGVHPRLLLGVIHFQLRQPRPRTGHQLPQLLQLWISVNDQRGKSSFRRWLDPLACALHFWRGKHRAVRLRIRFAFQLAQIPVAHLRAAGIG